MAPARGPKLPFTVAEYQRRLAAVQRGMAEAKLDGLLLNEPENIFYLSGYKTTGYYMFQTLIVPAEGKPTIFTNGLEQDNAYDLSWFKQVALYRFGGDPFPDLVAHLERLGLAGKVIGLDMDSWFLTVREFRRLAPLLPRAQLLDGSGIVERVRVIKSPAEMAYMREAARATDAAIGAAARAIREGRTENEVAAAAWRGLLLAGSEYPASQPYVVAGKRSGLAHQNWERGVLRKGDVVYLEMSGCIHRYHAPVMRTAALGAPKGRLARAVEASLTALGRVLEAIRPGVTAGDVDQVTRATMAEFGFAELYRHRTGYTVGTAFPPSWSEGHIMDLNTGDPRVLEPGMVFHLPIVLFLRGSGAAGFSETVLVTPTGNEVLTRFPRKLLLK